jgi:hypothetical protein
MNWRAGVVSIILGLLTTVLAELLGISERVSPVDMGVMNNFWVRVVGITLIVAILIYVVLYLINKRRKGLRNENAPSAFTVVEPPKTVYDQIELEEFGVFWKGKYGTFREYPYNSRDDPYVYVEGPYCPEDGQKLKSRTVPKWFVFTERAWVCPNCNKIYSRPTMHYLDEDRVVEDEMEQIFQQRASQQAKH